MDENHPSTSTSPVLNNSSLSGFLSTVLLQLCTHTQNTVIIHPSPVSYPQFFYSRAGCRLLFCNEGELLSGLERRIKIP